MLNNPLGGAAEEHALITGISVCRDHDEVRFELLRCVADLFVRCAGARLEGGNIAVGAVSISNGFEPFHKSLIPFGLRHQGKRQQRRRRLLSHIGDMQKVHACAELTGNRQRIWDRF